MRWSHWGLILVVALGCERRIDEPAGRRPTPPASEPAPASASLPKVGGTTTAETEPKERCIDPTPKEPARPKPPPGPDPACPEEPTERPDLDEGRVLFEEGELEVKVEIAREDAHRQRGLMYRRGLPQDQGMLFVFDRRRILSFWMKNTCIPLDMLFIDRDGLVVGIEENVPTMNERTYSVSCPSLYVLEVNAGFARRHGVKAGDRVRFEGLR